jgi:hypothetical protein
MGEDCASLHKTHPASALDQKGYQGILHVQQVDAFAP